MPDIFLSYSRQDVVVAAEMAAVLTAAGHDVWWDREIRAGDVYDQVLENALRESRLVIVLWSKTAVASDWVRSEATVAMQRGTLMPVMIEDCQRPVAFELRQSADLVGWKGNAKDPRLAAMLAAVARQLGAPATVPPTAVTQSGPSRRVLIGGAAGAAALAAGGFAGWKLWGGARDDGTASVVVLPFANLSGDPEQAFFSDGIAEELRNALSQIRGLKVIGRVSSEQFRDTSDLAAAAETLGVDHVLTGSVRRSPTTIRIGAQLVDGRTGVESWSQSFDRPSGDVLAIQSSIATSVVGALSTRLGKAAGAVVVGGTADPQAQALYLQADAMNPVSKDEALKRLSLLDSAVALDAAYALAYSRRANTLSTLATFENEFAPARLLQHKAMASSRRAVELAPDSGRALANYSTFLLSHLDGRGAYAAAQRAAQIEPGSVDAMGGVTRTLYAFDPQRAAVLANDVVARDPFNARAYQGRAQALINMRRYAEALAAAQKAGEFSNGSRGGRERFFTALLLGRFVESRAYLASLPPLLALPRTALLETLAGNRAAAEAAMVAMARLDPRLTSYGRAVAHAQRGETAAALAALNDGVATIDGYLQNIAFDPFLDPLRTLPAFKTIQDRIIPPDLIVPAKRGAI